MIFASDFRSFPRLVKTGLAFLSGLAASILGGETSDGEASRIEYQPLSIASLWEFGSLRSGRYGDNPERFRNDWVDHFGAFLTQSAQVGDNLSMHIGLGGVFEFQKREVISAEWGGTQYRSFFIGPSVADIEYRNGSGLSLQLGLFPYKYNPDATNLGEYLFRSGPYPSRILTGVYAMVNNTGAQMQGLRAGYTRGNFSADLLAFTETTMPSLYDFSAAALFKYRLGEGLLDIGAGVNAQRIIPVRPSKTSAGKPENSWFTRNQRTFTGYTGYYAEGAKAYERLKTEAEARGDQAASTRFADLAIQYKADYDSVSAWVDPARTPAKPDYRYYTQAGTVLMASLAFDPKAWFGQGIFGPQDLRLYGEAALLGVKNYPIFYEDRMDRLPVMAGFNLPGFGLIDLISVQYEYFRSPFMNSYLEVGRSSLAVPTVPQGADADRSRSDFNDIAKRDDVSWSILAKKEIVKGAWISAQAARDHARTVSIDSWFGPALEPTEILGDNKDWYWMIQLSFGI